MHSSRSTASLLVCIAFLFGAVAYLLAAVDDGDDTAAVRVLFVGNSYTGGIKGGLQALLRQQKIDTKVEFVHPGGKTLAWHLENGTADRIRRGEYDIVVLQEQSQTPAYGGLREKFLAASAGLAKVIRDSGARPVFYQTWGRRDGDKRNAHAAPTYAKMQDLLTEGYAQAATANKAEVVPVGEVWRAIRAADEPLARRLYAGDGSHPSPLGAYVTSLTFLATLYDVDPDEVAAQPALKLKPEELQVIRKAVREQVPVDP